MYMFLLGMAVGGFVSPIVIGFLLFLWYMRPKWNDRPEPELPPEYLDSEVN